MDVNVPTTPPTVSVEFTAVLFAAELVCRTQTLWLLLMVAAALVNVAVQPMEYVPPATLIGDGLLMPVIVIVFDVIGAFSATAL